MFFLSPGPDWAIFTPKGLCFPISGPDDKAPCPRTEAFPSLKLGCRAPPKASALSETEEGSGTRLCGKKDALTLLKAAVDLLVLQQLLAVVLKRLISWVRHDEKPSLIGDAGNGHGRPGGGRGGERGKSLLGKGGFADDPAPSGWLRLSTPPLSLLRLLSRRASTCSEGRLPPHCPPLVGLGKAGCCYSVHSERPCYS